MSIKRIKSVNGRVSFLGGERERLHARPGRRRIVGWEQSILKMNFSVEVSM